MVSACAYSGAYPTGYGRYTKNTEGVPEEMFDRVQASGFTHFQQSGTGAIRKYYNYFGFNLVPFWPDSRVNTRGLVLHSALTVEYTRDRVYRNRRIRRSRHTAT